MTSPTVTPTPTETPEGESPTAYLQKRLTKASFEVPDRDLGVQMRSAASALESLERRLHALTAERDEIANEVRYIHQQIKRGADTQDHGLMGNLRCIADHVSPSPEPGGL